MRKLLVSLLAACALFSSAAFAGGTWTNVTVTALQPATGQGFSPSGTMTVTLSASSTGGPSCASGAKTYAMVDVTTIGGAIVAQALLTARAAGNTITVYGSGLCTTNASIENIASIVE